MQTSSFGKNKKYARIFRYGAFLAAITVFSCTFLYKRNVIPELPNAEDNRVYEKKWEKYGAYFDKEDIVFSTNFSSEGCSTKWVFYRDLRIVTNAGVIYGTMPIPKFGGMTISFEPHLYNPDNSEVPLDEEAMKHTYEETGKITFPKVRVGSRATIKISFFRDREYYPAYSFSWNSPIPIRICRFTHKYSTNSVYDYKVYGSRYQPRIDSLSLSGGFRERSWTINEFEPRQHLTFLEYSSLSEPQVLIRLKTVLAWQEKYNKNKDVIKNYGKAIESTSYKIGCDSLSTAITKICCSGKISAVDRAKEIVYWVQKNIMQTGFEDEDRGNFLKNFRGSYLQAACLCRALLKKNGIKSRIVFVYNPNSFILDTNFLFFSPYYVIPFLIITVNGQESVADPYDVGYPTGEYPIDYCGIACIDPEKERIARLPAPLFGTQRSRNRLILDFRAAPIKYTLHIEHEGNCAAAWRCFYNTLKGNSRREFFEKMVKEINQSNRIGGYSVVDAEKYELPLKVVATFSCDETPLTFSNMHALNMMEFRSNYFDDITADRTEDVVVYHPSMFIDEVEIMKIPGKKVSCNMEMQALQNRLFTTSWTHSENDSSFVFQRTLSYKAGRVPKKEIASILPDCSRMNIFKNSMVSF